MWILDPFFNRITDFYEPTPILVPYSILYIFSLCMLSLSSDYY